VVTKEHRRFAELCDAVRRERYIGVCHGPPGVGKTLSARHYASWDTVSPQLTRVRFLDVGAPTLVLDSRTVLYTPKVHNTPRIVDNDVRTLQDRLGWLIEIELAAESGLNLADTATSGDRLVELLVVDEARYPQLYSRIGFAHEYRALSSDELTFVLEHHWAAIGLTLSAGDFTDAEAIGAVARITNGNFRLVQRLFAQITRILEINNVGSAPMVDLAALSNRHPDTT